MKSWKPSTLKQYNVYLTKWLTFCQSAGKDPLIRDMLSGLEFLRRLFNKEKLSHSAINSARSALSCIFDKPPFGEDPLVTRFMKGVYNARPSLPRYKETWDVSVVLKFLEKWSPGRFLSRKQLSFKLATLLTLVSGQRIQTIHALNIDNMHISNESVTFTLDTLIKQSSVRNTSGREIVIPIYEVNKKICPVLCLKQYLKRTEKERKNSQLFIGIQRPYKPVTRSTISRWVKATLTLAGINTEKYKTHSARAASSSAAAKTIDIAMVLKAAGWRRANTFAKFYNKKIEDSSGIAFGKAVLNTK